MAVDAGSGRYLDLDEGVGVVGEIGIDRRETRYYDRYWRWHHHALVQLAGGIAGRCLLLGE